MSGRVVMALPYVFTYTCVLHNAATAPACWNRCCSRTGCWQVEFWQDLQTVDLYTGHAFVLQQWRSMRGAAFGERAGAADTHCCCCCGQYQQQLCALYVQPRAVLQCSIIAVACIVAGSVVCCGVGAVLELHHHLLSTVMLVLEQCTLMVS